MIKLRLISQSPEGELIQAESVAASTAIQCYAPGVAKMVNRGDEKALGIARSTLEAGHHTTRMHTYYTWQLVGVTRSITHDVFHSTPFYNSEQQSQRYVLAKEGFFLVPKGLTTEQYNFYRGSADFANKAYLELLEGLKPLVEERVKSMNPIDGWRVSRTKERLENKIRKLSQEIARYVLPLGQLTTYFHTLSELQLLRLFRASKMPGFTDEAKFVIASMIAEVAAKDKTILNELRSPVDEAETDVTQPIDIEQFDSLLGKKFSALLDLSSGIDPSKLLCLSRSRLLGDVFDVGMFSNEISQMREIWLTFATKLSHAGDSQRQRHRRTAAGVMPIGSIFNGRADFITPLVIRENDKMRQKYENMVNQMFNNVNTALETGMPKDIALLLLPNAVSIRIVESGDLFDWVHRWKQRLCYLAQEEIFFVSVHQVKDVLEKMPELRNVILAPCGIRQLSKISPRCPEGDRWCGQPVFNWQIEEYEKHRLI